MRIATSVSVDHIRWAKRRSRESSSEETFEAPEAAQQAVSELDPSLRTVFVLQELGRLSVTEVSRMLDLSESEVRSRLRRAHNELGQRLKQNFTEETIKRIHKSEPAVLPQGFDKRLHKDVQRWLM
jgi:DNA-directed RNA polymerase specialized sigma24 family protein